MKEQEFHAYERNQKTDQRIYHRTREEPKEQIIAPEKNQKETKDATQAPRETRPVGSVQKRTPERK